MTKYYIDTESGAVVDRIQLQDEFEQLQIDDPQTYDGITFEMYLANCTSKNGFLQEVI